VAVGEAPILGMAVPGFIEALAPDREERKKKAEAWAEMARKGGIRTKVLIDSEPLTTVDGILSAAEKERVDLIALVLVRERSRLPF